MGDRSGGVLVRTAGIGLGWVLGVRSLVEAFLELPAGLTEITGQLRQLLPAEQHKHDHQNDQKLRRPQELLHDL